MKKFFRPAFPHLSRLALVTTLVLALFVADIPTSAAPLQQGTIDKVYISNVSDGIFVVSWTTETPSTASVNYGTTTALGSMAADTLNPIPTTTHYVNVSGLSPNTTYYFDTISGSTIDNNSGAHYTVTTGPSIGSTPTIQVQGAVFQNNGSTPVPYAIVYLQVAHLGVDSQLVALRTFSPGGQFSYNLGNLRTADFQTLFNEETGDPISLIGQGGSLGTGQITPLVPDTSGSIGNIILDNVPNAINLSTMSAISTDVDYVASGLLILSLSLAGVFFIGKSIFAASQNKPDR